MSVYTVIKSNLILLFLISISFAQEPEFINYSAIRQVDQSLGKILGDIESHMPSGHIYKDNDKITWGHETTHGINSNIRNKYHTLGKINAFYLLNNKACIIKEPNCTIKQVAQSIPQSLRGKHTYNLYLIQQAGQWNDRPLYLWDEWSAYINGEEVRQDLNIPQRECTLEFSLNFSVYSICVGLVSQSEDLQLKNFLKWQLKRNMNLVRNSKFGDLSSCYKYWNKVQNEKDADRFRELTRLYLGKDWTQEELGF